MCVTMLGQIVFMIIMFVGLVLTLASMFTPGWNSFKATHNNVDDFKSGILICSDNSFPKATPSTAGSGAYDCKQWWNDQPTWEKVVIGCMSLAVLSQLAALIWTGLTFCACCCKRFLVHPLPILASLATVLLIIAIAIYGIKNKDSLDKMPQNYKALYGESTVSYSFYIACGAAVCMIADIIIGVVVVRIAKTPF